jgi:FMN phosphatase YigB (HAD superfamily)
MQYIFDFDHTLYETSRFSTDAKAYKENGTLITPAIWDLYDASNYFYEDTLSFLASQKKEDVVVLSAATPAYGPEAHAFQEAKLDRSGVGEYVSQIIVMEGEKGSYIQKLYANQPTVFVDDTLSQLLSAKECCPEVRLVQMVRPGRETYGPVSDTAQIPVISSLYELYDLFA